MIAEIRPGSGLEPVVYAREPSGALVSRTDWNTFEEHCYYFDELGSTRLIVNEQGNVTAHDQYTGSVGDSQPYRYVGRLGYYTHYQDQNMDLLQLGVRFYDPKIGRFTQRDAVCNMGESAYAYCGNTPTWWVDPSGFTRTRVNNDSALKKCLNKLRGCINWAGSAIDKVGDRWFTDTGDKDADMWTTWVYQDWSRHSSIVCQLSRGAPPTRLGPSIHFNPREDQSWHDRNTSIGGFAEFCIGVLHELMHVNRGMWKCGTEDHWKEKKDEHYFDDQARSLYRKCRG